MKRLVATKANSLRLSSAYGFFIVISASVIILGAFLLIRQDFACGEQTPSLHSSSGEVAQGIMCQIRRDETGPMPKLLVDLRNTGRLTFTGYMSTEANFALRVDAQWYYWQGEVDVKGARYDPGSEYRTSVDLSDRNWGNQSYQRGIGLLPGNHSVQVAFLLKERISRRCSWTTSNVLDLTLANGM
jgi:hypothetical protein